MTKQTVVSVVLFAPGDGHRTTETFLHNPRFVTQHYPSRKFPGKELNRKALLEYIQETHRLLDEVDAQMRALPEEVPGLIIHGLDIKCSQKPWDFMRASWAMFALEAGKYLVTSRRELERYRRYCFSEEQYHRVRQFRGMILTRAATFKLQNVCKEQT
jgi:hypothetical protein